MMTETRKYRKKPVVIEAYQTDKVMYIETLEGIHKADVGDYIITGIKGEQYPCKPDIFEKTYEPVKEDTPKISMDIDAENDYTKAFNNAVTDAISSVILVADKYHVDYNDAMQNFAAILDMVVQSCSFENFEKTSEEE